MNDLHQIDIYIYLIATLRVLLFEGHADLALFLNENAKCTALNWQFMTFGLILKYTLRQFYFWKRVPCVLCSVCLVGTVFMQKFESGV